MDDTISLKLITYGFISYEWNIYVIVNKYQAFELLKKKVFWHKTFI